MNLSPELVVSVLVALGSGVGVYAAIRADLARLHERSTTALDAAKRAHERIDLLRATR